MFAADYEIAIGSKETLKVTHSVQSGTATINANPAPAVTVLAADRSVIAGPAATAHYDTAAAQDVSMEYVFDATALQVEGEYIVQFLYSVTESATSVTDPAAMLEAHVIVTP